jgi:hypothetical protein
MAMIRAIPETTRVPAISVGMPNSPRRGYQPSARSWDGSIWVRKLTAPPIRLATIRALMTIVRIAEARKTRLTTRSRRRRAAFPARKRSSAIVAWVIESPV